VASSKRTKKIDREALRHVCQAFLLAIGENPDRPGLKDTPRRFADHWADFIEYQPGNVATTFDSIRSDQMVVVSGMRVHSFCEHHILPFWCEIAIGPEGPRPLEVRAHRAQARAPTASPGKAGRADRE
jgi:GTP cyclohydrolase I